jgi:crotonobetainyl-CoA:carnitine CoA-transferase CaiB-like acyl-CoA transferase
MTGDPDRPPARVALATTDYLTAVYAAFGAVAAIQERHRSGRGQVVDVALYETAFSQMESYVPAFEKTGFVPQRVGPNLPTMAPNSLYPTADGSWILIAANSNAIFKRLAELMGMPGLLQDERYATIAARGQPANMRALDALIAGWTAGFDARTLEPILRGAQVPTSRVYTIADIFEDPHYVARDMLVRVPHPELGHTVQAGVVPKFSRTPGAIRHTGPAIGADTCSVLDELGFDPATVQSWIHEGLVRAAAPTLPTTGGAT